MGTPATRTPIRIARGSASALETNKADILEGEIAWDTTNNKLLVKEGSNLEESSVSDSTKVPLAGGTMTGLLTLSGAPTATGHATTKTYVDTADGLKLSLAGGTMTGNIVMSGTETVDGRDLSVDGTKLDGIAAGAEVNVQSDWDAGSGDAQILNKPTLVALSGDNNWTGAQRGNISALTSASAITIDMSVSNNYSLTLGHNVTFNNPTNQTAGQSGSLFLTQDGTGSRTAAWGTSGATSEWKWKGGTAPTLSTAANAVDRVDYIILSNGNIHAVATLDIK